MNPEEENTPELDSSAAIASIGEAYYRGLGMPANYEQAFRYFRKAADMGSSAALCRMGNCYQFGHGVEADPEEALSCYEDASSLGEPEAMWRIGDFYWDGVPGLMNSDREQAADFYMDALSAVEYRQDVWNAPDVYYRVARCLQEGIGADCDPINAIVFYRSAVEGYLDRIDSGDLACEEQLEACEEAIDAVREEFPEETAQLFR